MMHKVEIEEQDVTEIFSPYTGKCVVDKDGEINENDDSLLFVYAGMAGDYAYISDKLRDIVDEDIESINIEDLPSKIEANEGTLLEVDNGFNGINFYGFISPD